MGEIIFDYRKFTENVQACSNKLYNNRKCIYCNICLPSVYKKYGSQMKFQRTGIIVILKFVGERSVENSALYVMKNLNHWNSTSSLQLLSLLSNS